MLGSSLCCHEWATILGYSRFLYSHGIKGDENILNCPWVLPIFSCIYPDLVKSNSIWIISLTHRIISNTLYKDRKKHVSVSVTVFKYILKTGQRHTAILEWIFHLSFGCSSVLFMFLIFFCQQVRSDLSKPDICWKQNNIQYISVNLYLWVTSQRCTQGNALLVGRLVCCIQC